MKRNTMKWTHEKQREGVQKWIPFLDVCFLTNTRVLFLFLWGPPWEDLPYFSPCPGLWLASLCDCARPCLFMNLRYEAGIDVAQQMCVSAFIRCLCPARAARSFSLVCCPLRCLGSLKLRAGTLNAVSRTAQFLCRWRSSNNWLIHSLLFWK